ncbi:MAG: beta-lactamase family protein [Bacteroidetes bacterium]|nr:beta-lactamase family protein [Bacteroidota bacterium]
MQNVLKMCLIIIIALNINGCDSSSTQPNGQQKTSLQEELCSARIKSGVPAMAAAVVTSEQISIAVDGVRKLGDTASVKPSDFFHIGSNVKAFTSMLAGILIDEGNINWNSLVIDNVPVITSSILNIYNSVTLEDLLRHRSGLPPCTDETELVTLPILTGSSMDQRLGFCKWVFGQSNVAAPGDTNVYSNAGYIAAAVMLEQSANKSYEELLQQKILQPLGLHIKFGWPAYNDPDQPWGHIINNSGGLEPFDPNAPENDFPGWASPAGNMSISIEDYARFLQYILQAKKGDEFVISKQSLNKIMTSESGYGMGWVSISWGGEDLLCHGGTAQSFYAFTLLDFEKDMAVAVFTNSYSPDIGDKMQIGAVYFHDISLK